MSKPFFSKVDNVQLLEDERIKGKNRNKVMTEEQKRKVPLTRPVVSEEHPGEIGVKEPEQKRPSGKLKKELDRLKGLPAIPGKMTIGMMGEFKEFP